MVWPQNIFPPCCDHSAPYSLKFQPYLSISFCFMNMLNYFLLREFKFAVPLARNVLNLTLPLLSSSVHVDLTSVCHFLLEAFPDCYTERFMVTTFPLTHTHTHASFTQCIHIHAVKGLEQYKSSVLLDIAFFIIYHKWSEFLLCIYAFAFLCLVYPASLVAP